MIDANTLSPFKPVQAVVVFKKDSDYYLETHDILEKDGQYAWQEGIPFAKEQLKDLSLALGEQAFSPIKIDGILPENLLYFTQSFTNLTLVWWLPPSIQELHFKEKIKLPTGNVKLPGLIFSVKGDSLDLYAVKGTEKPGLKTQLFKAPFHNISTDGSVCMGTVKDRKQRDSIQAELARWEKRFFKSYFTHYNDEKVLATGFNLQVIFKQLMKSGDQFPEEALAPSPILSLEKLIKVL